MEMIYAGYETHNPKNSTLFRFSGFQDAKNAVFSEKSIFFHKKGLTFEP